MRTRRANAWIAIGALLSGAPAIGLTATEGSLHNDQYRIEEPVLRSRVISGVPPVIPSSFRPNTRAVTVADVELLSDGTLLAVEILEAPSPDVARAFRAALLSWKFRPVGEVNARYVGKLTFYIVPSHESARVLSPDEMFSSEISSANARKSASNTKR